MSYKPRTHLSYQAARRSWSARIRLFILATREDERYPAGSEEEQEARRRYLLLKRHLKKAIAELLKYRYGYVPHKPWHGKQTVVIKSQYNI